MKHDEINGTDNVSVPSMGAEGADVPALLLVRSKWIGLGNEREIAEDDVRRDRRAYVARRQEDETEAGEAYHFTTDETFDASNFKNDPTDSRWRCAAWLRKVQDYADRAALTFRRVKPNVTKPPIVCATPRSVVPTPCFCVLWSCNEGGGLVVSNTEGIDACGECVGCANPPDGLLAPVESWVYFIQATTGGPVKIGRSSTPRARLASLQTANASELRIIGMMPGGPVMERALHAVFAADRARPGGEWFTPSPLIEALIKELGGRPA